MAELSMEKDWTPERIKNFTEKLQTAWLKHPHLRFGQLVVNIASSTEPMPELFYMNDTDFYFNMTEWL